MAVTDAQFNLLKRQVEELKRREYEADLDLRAKLLGIVASIEKKHGIGKYSSTQSTFVLSIDQEYELVEKP